MSSLNFYVFTDLSSSSSSPSSDNDDDDDEKLVALVGLYEINNATMIEILTAAKQSKKKYGSILGRKYIHCERRNGHDQLFADYFPVNQVYPPSTFQRHFRMRRDLYLQILNAIQAHDIYFVKKEDACHILGFVSASKDDFGN
ncbi:hypothetical protein ACSBR1_012728 [Camellia fascicularis]